MGLYAALVLLAVFVVNVTLGSINGQAPLGNVAEMVLLFIASAVFVIEVLRREAREKRDDPKSDEPSHGRIRDDEKG